MDVLFPCSEEDLYDHLCRQRNDAVPSCRLRSVLEDVTIVRHMFGVVGLEPCTKKQEVHGSCYATASEHHQTGATTQGRALTDAASCV